ncbi:MAG: hypothetical protein CLLPBCKN_002940 [Chroococcidiopsis cubana SAG 39.79]|uniref:Uncharacterized protein n=1 Tax=Chroococcidiopsis cubana SAG 39.79 TaxID=388085 RepID=A0AB37UK69_9CYAN|nr:hypothetical protein [Chroococcidiopsis cubana]MDZ4873544.1 hypothetical protein [Chroococcidiopsis cubana SAG 39.79]PSB52520.1 hypothetical protein C7B79_35860 [Chroococcidiopsis cubana CCALA 043]RUT11729.1 hypothetical protein DSM107010_29060 [Chroococcidiopsis cubana SAG 39.79]
MNQSLKFPDLEKVKQRAARMREICLMFDAQIMLLDELIAQVEAENRNNPINVYRRGKGNILLEELLQKQIEEKDSK